MIEERLFKQFIFKFLVMLVQTAVTLATIILGFNIPCRGPFGWLAVITVLQVQSTHYTRHRTYDTIHTIHCTHGTLHTIHYTRYTVHTKHCTHETLHITNDTLQYTANTTQHTKFKVHSLKYTV